VSGTTATLVVIDGFTVTVASVGDSRCILDTQGGELQLLTVDHHLEENAEEREHVTASGGEVGRLNLFGGQEVSHFSSSESVTCLSSINSCMNAYAGGTLGREIIAIIDEERTGFDEMEVMALASLFWRRRRQPIAKTER
jgi:serine/threonine protein phosphatase PrpC